MTSWLPDFYLKNLEVAKNIVGKNESGTIAPTVPNNQKTSNGGLFEYPAMDGVNGVGIVVEPRKTQNSKSNFDSSNNNLSNYSVSSNNVNINNNKTTITVTTNVNGKSSHSIPLKLKPLNAKPKGLTNTDGIDNAGTGDIGADDYDDDEDYTDSETDDDGQGLTKHSNSGNSFLGKEHALLKVNKKSYLVVCNLDTESHTRTYSKRKKYLKTNIAVETIKKKRHQRNHLSMCLTNCRYEVIPLVAKRLGYKMVKESDLWNVCWTEATVPADFCRQMRRFQKINHFPGMFEICRKDLLARNLNRMLRIFPKDYQIFPKSWIFPADYGEAVAYARSHKNHTYILKPDQGSQGKGIWLTKNLKEIKANERMICQVYVTKPLLIDGYKFDLRVYALLTSIDPLRIFVYNEGLARFATSKYKEPCGSNITNTYMHLTNYSLNKHSRTFCYDEGGCGSKRKFSTLNKILSGEGYNVEELWSNIDDIIIKTILSAYPMLKHNYSASFPNHDIIQACFEILGFDILIDHKLRPYILEVNHSPSFHTSDVIDKDVKEALIHDTLVLLNISNTIKRRVLSEDRKRVQSRLLHRRDTRDDASLGENNIAGDHFDMDQINSTKSMWMNQLYWEENHISNFRRIMPFSDDIEKYTKYFEVHSQASVYSDTASSKRREECAKKQRIELQEKKNFRDSLLLNLKRKNNVKLTGEDGLTDDTSKLTKKVKVRKLVIKKNFYDPDTILRHEEKERLTSLAQREFLIKSCGFVETIYTQFHRAGILTDTDRKKYREIYTKMSSPTKEELVNQPDQYQMHPQHTNSMHQKPLPIVMLSSGPGSSQNDMLGIRKHLSSCTGIDASKWVKCDEIPVGTRHRLPIIPTGSGFQMNKTAIVRQATNSVKRHNLENRFLPVDK